MTCSSCCVPSAQGEAARGLQVSYRSYWTRMILSTLHTHGHNLSIKEISERTAIRTDDIVTTLQSLSLIKYWKGDHLIAVNSKQVRLRVPCIDRGAWEGCHNLCARFCALCLWAVLLRPAGVQGRRSRAKTCPVGFMRWQKVLHMCCQAD